MKKKIVSILLSLCLVSTSLPTTMMAYASENHLHCICGASHVEIGDHTAEVEGNFTAWTSNTSLPDTAGSYFLTDDVTISATWQPANNTVLCLNGHTITCTADDTDAITINSGISFTLTDCKTGDKMGKITHETGKKGSGVSVFNGSFHMYGGNISDNSTTDNGGGVNTFGSLSTFNMYGGSISGNLTTAGGGGVYTFGNLNAFNMYGGSISGNTATAAGGGVHSWGTFNMHGGSISGNRTAAEGGGVYNRTDSFTMYGGSITNNAGDYGGGVYIWGTFNMSGGSISGNTATEHGGGVYIWIPDSFTVSGNVNITGNNKQFLPSGTTPDNVYLDNGNTISIGGALTNEALIGVYTKSKPTGDNSVAITGANETDYINNFTSDDTHYEIYNDSSNNTIKIKKIYTHEHSGVKVDGQAATCTAAGWKDYYKCSDSDCNKYFKEQTCTTEITNPDTWKANEGKVAALGHDWKYSANGAVVTASCSRKATCKEADKTLTISVISPAYSGNAAAINIGTTQERTAWKTAGFTLPTTVEHYKVTTKLNSAPTTAGTYTAKVTCEGATASVKYTIIDKTSGTPAFTAEKLKENSIALNKKTVVKWKKSKLSVSWGKVSGADGYDIFAAQCVKKMDMKSPCATVKGGKNSVIISSIGREKLSRKGTYKVKVKAYIWINGQKFYIGDGQTNHVTGKSNKTYTNAKTVKVSQKSVFMKKGKTSQIKATIAKESKRKKLLSKGHGPSLRYYSTNTKIATVTSKGKIKTKAKGTCYIYVTALNGVNARVKVTVK